MKKYFCLLFLFFFFNGCRKDKPVNEIKYIPRELKDYMYFKKGTWWVYEEETTHERDSVIVFYNDDSLITFDGTNGSPKAGTYEYFDCKTHSSYDDYGYYYTCNTTWSANGRTPVFRDKTKPGDFVGETIIMFNRFIIGDKLYPLTVNSELTLTGIYDSINFSSHFFHNVVKFHESRNSTEFLDSSNFFISRNTGIIRKEIFSNNKIWNLVNFHIVQ